MKITYPRRFSRAKRKALRAIDMHWCLNVYLPFDVKNVTDWLGTTEGQEFWRSTCIQKLDYGDEIGTLTVQELLEAMENDTV